MNSRRWPYYILIFVGLFQVFGMIPGFSALRGLGLATVASPLPLVFSHFRGNETFNADFYLKLFKDNHEVYGQKITPKLYSQLLGPYNRRNVFGAVFAYGPYLNQPQERELLNTILKNAFCNNGPLAREFSIDVTFDAVQIVVLSKMNTPPKPHEIKVMCP
ncbi:MAG: hypothetical protein H6626_12985 [Pseudobdellovibrionaceae bacterium]|nr:hypothetical protein [Bdellovibrionales bacterium]USN47089.1 MAG: hypothetical protein H6626_12985 [Pseudobdellovibrionaceae bacterium]